MRVPSVGKSAGFTLVELLVTLSIAAIVTAYGVPAMRNFASDSKITGVATSMIAAINQARSEAISTGKPVSIYAVSDQGMAGNGTTIGAGTFSVATNAWSDGFRVLQRTRLSSGAISTTSADTTLLGQSHFGYQPANDTSVVVRRVTAGTDSGATAVFQLTFNRSGQLIEETTGAVISNDVQVLICDGGRTGEKGRKIVINNRGNIKNYTNWDSHYANPCT